MPMNKLVECVPNFSEGRRPEVLEAIAAAIRAVPGVTLLDMESDKDHNRSVFTFVGEPVDVKHAALDAAEEAVRLIDMERVEPTLRCPPLLQQCIDLVHVRVGEMVRVGQCQ